ncbi:hypothetical protein SARC_05591 [Sphaeroforma arctica JP610]|uniref:Uncharacterized protein n=1 Tax=Sphaeroforma arctica JP610 TaxID=667725 RepID=A0A0L0FZ73_9EUKA|nr:hypothetical protein SARC_05591 [Sphaeroforma arctica JP610]KNC82122.1 hypothetical protein SARC_05591 [Sphaeroforma arctica JP610]|eukprot:XP_014156024.1 hypothetical protein SARC_05591 [Sphaeroforma arctica JP610]
MMQSDNADAFASTKTFPTVVKINKKLKDMEVDLRFTKWVFSEAQQAVLLQMTMFCKILTKSLWIVTRSIKSTDKGTGMKRKFTTETGGEQGNVLVGIILDFVSGTSVIVRCVRRQPESNLIKSQITLGLTT